jgi:two-component system, NtrC family, response regulator AtoC
MRGRVLIVDDDRNTCELLDEFLTQREYSVAWKLSADEAFGLLDAEEFDAVITDLNLPGTSGLQLSEWIKANRPDLPAIVITAFGSLDTAVAAIRAGAYDFITKPFEMEAMVMTLDRAIQYRTLREELRRLRSEVAGPRGFPEIAGKSMPMIKLLDEISRVADSESSVLITGETGTGKELVARALHKRSKRNPAPFVPVSCSAMPEPLLESELFGHVKGAFTDAKTARKGLFLQASGGTLFLDEIGEMPLGLQPKLLRALQERRIRPVGGDEEMDIDVRIIAATNRDLETAVEEKVFREDLFFRINVIHIEVPPLRARGGDILLLAQGAMRRFADRTGKPVTGISSAAAEKLLTYTWPGNVRELENCIERAVVFTRYDELLVEDLPEKIRNFNRSQVLVASDDPSELVSLEEVERRYILRVLEVVGGNKSEAARILGLDRRTLYRKVDRYLPDPRPKPAPG